MAIKKSDLYSSLWKLCDELRGGMDASQYKDYVLVLLFVKYVSDRAGHDDSLLDVPKGGSFKDLVTLKGKPNIGDGVNKVIGKLAEANDLRGVIDVADFNDDNKLGKAKDMVDRLTNLIAIFENPALDFSGNTADGDDLLGDAYEYLMRNFATESGKSKGQFYTPAEVSRIMASVIGINKAKSQKETIYDPTCGSGSLLLKAHASAKSATGFDLAIYGQEMDNATAALSRMNMLIHNAAGAEIKNNNTLSTPEFKDTKTGGLKTFDYVVANPPFSVKSWTNGVNIASDEFKRFEYGVPPEKNGDYAFLLHILASLKSTGKGAVILPHGVLFRGNAEGNIRKEIVKRGYIKGIIGLPANLFYGTGIPACVIVIDKEGAAGRTGIFMIDASKGFIKDGPKNRLRERDLHLIVDTFLNQTEVDKYSRMVPITEIADAKNDYNLNLPRYIDTSDPEDLHDLDAHLNGGIPNRDIDALGDFWKVLPKLRKSLFESAGRDGYSRLAVPANEVPVTIANSEEFKKFSAQIHESLVSWATHAEKKMKALGDKTRPKDFIADLSELLLNTFKGLPLVDSYEVYQGLMSLWEETLKDDVYMVIESGWEAGGKLTALPAKAKGEKRTGRVDYTINKIEYRSELIPPELLIETFFADKAQQIESDLAAAGERLNELAEQHGGEEMLLSDYTNDKGEFTKKLVTDGLKVKGIDKEEKKALQEVSDAFDAEADAKKASKELEEAVIARYKKLTEAEIKTLLIQTKWIGAVSASIETVLDSVRRTLSGRLQTLASRYDDTLPTITTTASTKMKAVENHLKKMGPVVVVPADWKEVRLGDLGSTFGGLTGKSSKDFGDGNSSFVTFMNVMSNVVLNNQGTEKVRIGNGERQSQLLEGDVIFNGSSETPEEVGFGSAVPIELNGFYLNSFCFGFRRKDTTSLDPKFFAYLTRSPLGRDIIRPMAQGSTRYNIAKTNLLNGRFPLPPLKEQEVIAEALSDADSAIESLDALIAKKRDVKQATMQQLLTGRTRLPGFIADWKEVSIGSFTDCKAGGTPSTSVPAYWGGDIRWMSSGELNLKRVREVSGRITQFGLENSSAQLFPADSVLIGLAGQGKTRGTAAINLVNLTTNQSIAAIFPSGRHDSKFLFYVMETKYKELRDLSDGGGGRGGLNLAIIKDVRVTIPELDEQKKISEVLWLMDDELEALTEQVSKLRMVKEGMMQDLLTGKVRLV